MEIGLFLTYWVSKYDLLYRSSNKGYFSALVMKKNLNTLIGWYIRYFFLGWTIRVQLTKICNDEIYIILIVSLSILLFSSFVIIFQYFD